MDNMDELKNQTEIDNSKLEKILEKDITPQMQVEFFEILKESQFFLPVTPSANMFEGLEDAKVGDTFTPKGQAGFDINYLTDAEGNKAVPLFTSDEMMEKAGLRSSVIVMFASDLADMLKESDRYQVIAINPFTDHDINMPFEAFISLLDEPSQEEKEIISSINEMVEMLRKHSYTLDEDMAFMLRLDENFMVEQAVNGVFTPRIPFTVSTSPDYGKDLKYTNILLFEKGKKVLPVAGGVELNTIIAPGTELIIEKELNEFTTVWKCGAQPFYD